MSFKKEDDPDVRDFLNHYECYPKRMCKDSHQNKTHSIHSWDEWCEICDEHGECAHDCFEITLDKGGGNYECFEYEGDVPKMD